MGGERDLCVIGTFPCSSRVSFACTQTEFDPLFYRYNKVDAGVIHLLRLSCYARSSCTQRRHSTNSYISWSALPRWVGLLQEECTFCSRNSSISQSPREVVSKNKSHRHVNKLTGYKHSDFGYSHWARSCLTLYLNHLQSGLLWSWKL